MEATNKFLSLVAVEHGFATLGVLLDQLATPTQNIATTACTAFRGQKQDVEGEALTGSIATATCRICCGMTTTPTTNLHQ
jgi:hypothetical protein